MNKIFKLYLIFDFNRYKIGKVYETNKSSFPPKIAKEDPNKITHQSETTQLKNSKIINTKWIVVTSIAQSTPQLTILSSIPGFASNFN